MKIFTCTVLALLFFARQGLTQFSAVWNTPFQHTTTPGFSNEGRFVAEDAAGNIFVLSDVTSDTDPGGMQGTGTFHYVSLNKYSTNGALLTALNIEVFNHVTAGFDHPGAFGLDVDASGNVYIGYATWDAVSGFDIALGKYDNNLVRIWVNSYITSQEEAGVDLKLDASGTLYALVKTTGLQSVYSIIGSVPFSAPANVVYSFPPDIVGLNSIDPDGGQILYAGGFFIKAGYKNAYLVAIDLVSNSISWGSLYTPKGILGDDEINQVTVGIDGNIYSVGTTWQDVNGNQTLVLKNNPGNPKFAFVDLLSAGGLGLKGYFIDASESGWLYICAADQIDPYAYVFRIPDDAIYTAPGVIAFQPVPVSSYTSVNSLMISDMKISGSKNIYLTGNITATGPAGDFSCSYLSKASVVFGNALVDAGGYAVDGDFNDNYAGIGLALDYAKTDVYWLRNNWDDQHTSEAVELIDVSVPSPLRKLSWGNLPEVSIGLNPASGMININSVEMIRQVIIYNVSGSVVLIKELNDHNPLVDVSMLANGNYLCRIITERGETVKKVVRY